MPFRDPVATFTSPAVVDSEVVEPRLPISVPSPLSSAVKMPLSVPKIRRVLPVIGSMVVMIRCTPLAGTDQGSLALVSNVSGFNAWS